MHPVPTVRIARLSGRGASPQSVVLLEKGRAHRKGEEVRISYGDKSNEELLFTYGFAVPGNPYDVALLAPPLPPAVELDDVLQMRLALCAELGVEPRSFLPLAALREGRRAAEAALLGARRPPPPRLRDCVCLRRVFGSGPLTKRTPRHVQRRCLSFRFSR